MTSGRASIQISAVFPNPLPILTVTPTRLKALAHEIAPGPFLPTFPKGQ